MGRANSTAHLLPPLCRRQPHRQHVQGLKIFAFISYFYLEHESRTLLRISMKFFNGENADGAIECSAFRLLPFYQSEEIRCKQGLDMQLQQWACRQTMLVLLCLKHVLERDGKSPKPQILLPPSLESEQQKRQLSATPCLFFESCPALSLFM